MDELYNFNPALQDLRWRLFKRAHLYGRKHYIIIQVLTAEQSTTTTKEEEEKKMNKPIPIPPSGYPSVINAVTHAMASAEIHEEDFNADTDKYMIEVATNIWNEDSGDSGRRSYCSLVETLMAKNKRIKRREEQNPELFFSDMVKRANSFTINMQEKKTCNGCKNVDRISDKVFYVYVYIVQNGVSFIPRKKNTNLRKLSNPPSWKL